MVWPTSAVDLEQLQRELAERSRQVPAWHPPADRPLRVGGVFAASARGGEGVGTAGDPAWVAAVVLERGSMLDFVVLADRFDAPYAPGLLALREGRLLGRALEHLVQSPDVVLVNASGRDHPRRAGLALHLGAASGLPTIGVTDRPLLAEAPWPAPERGATAELRLEHEIVGYRLRTAAGVRPVVVHAGWRVDAQVAWRVVLQVSAAGRTPAPLREARRLARSARLEGLPGGL